MASTSASGGGGGREGSGGGSKDEGRKVKVAEKLVGLWWGRGRVMRKVVVAIEATPTATPIPSQPSISSLYNQ